MKKLLLKTKATLSTLLMLAILASASVSCYNDDAVWEEIDNIKKELADLRATIESELNAIKEIVNGQVTVTDVQQQADGSKVITLSDGTKISVYPKAQDVPSNLVTVYNENGVLYWAMYDGLGNANPIEVGGKMVPVADVAPQTQVVDGAIEVSFDGGNTWIKTGYSESVADSIIKDIEVTYSDWQTDDEGNPIALYCTITFADGSKLNLGMQNGKLVLPFDSLFVAYGTEMPFTIDVLDAADFMTTTPRGWECDVEFDAKNERMTLYFTAPEYEAIASGEAKAEGVAKLMVVFNNGSSAIASIKLSTNPAQTFFTQEGVYVEVGYGTSYLLCGISPASVFNADNIIQSCKNVLGGSTSNYVYQLSFMESLTEFVEYTAMRSAGLNAGTEYTFWYIAPRTDEAGDLYVDANELVQVKYVHSSVAFEATETSFFDATVKLDVKGSQGYMLGLVETSEFNAAELTAYYTENYDYLSANRSDVNFEGSILELMERTSQKLDYGTEYTLYYIAKSNNRVILEDNVLSWSFTTKNFTEDGVIELKSVGEPVIDYKSIDVTLDTEEEHIAIFYNAMPSYMATAYPDDSYIIDMLLSEGTQVIGSEAVVAKYQGTEPGEKVTFFAVAVDAEGKIGTPYKQEYTTKAFVYNDLELTLTLTDYKVDNTLITPSCEGAVSYRYIYCALDDSKWKEVYGGTAKKAGEYIIQNPNASDVYDTAKDDALVDGNIFLQGLNTETEYVLVCLAVDAEGIPSKPATCYFEPIANIGNMVKRSDENWAEGKPEIIMGETAEVEFFNFAWYTKPQKGYVAYSMVDHPENLVSDYFGTNVNTPEKLIAYIIAGCDNGRKDCGHKCEWQEDNTYTRTWKTMEDLNGDGRYDQDEWIEHTETGLPGVYNFFFYGTKDEHLIYVTWVGEDGNFHEPFAWDPTNDVEVELKWE